MGAIKLVHDRIQYLTQSLTTTVKTLGQICDQANKQAADSENNAFEVKKLGASSRNEVQILKTNLNEIKSRMSSMEAGTHPAISKVQILIKDVMTIKIEEADLDRFGKELQTQLVPALEVMSVKIQQLEINQVRSLGSINPIMPPSRTPVVSESKGL